MDWVDFTMKARSWARVGRVRSRSSFCVHFVAMVVSPCPRASKARIPASGRSFWISLLNAANERPDEPAPWCVTINGPEPDWGVM